MPTYQSVGFVFAIFWILLACSLVVEEKGRVREQLLFRGKIESQATNVIHRRLNTGPNVYPLHLFNSRLQTFFSFHWNHHQLCDTERRFHIFIRLALSCVFPWLNCPPICSSWHYLGDEVTVLKSFWKLLTWNFWWKCSFQFVIIRIAIAVYHLLHLCLVVICKKKKAPTQFSFSVIFVALAIQIKAKEAVVLPGRRGMDNDEAFIQTFNDITMKWLPFKFILT